MAYASSSRLPSRESIYPQPPPSDFLNHLEDCVQATERCVLTLGSGLANLNPGTEDLPRLTKVLRNRHHYLLLPHPTIVAHKTVLSSSLAPQIDQLIAKAENVIEAQSGKEARLEERIQILQSARLPTLPKTAPTHPQTFRGLDNDTETSLTSVTNSVLANLDMKEASIVQRRKIMTLKAKRERLEKERDRLGL